MGLPGSGKTTLAKHLVPMFNAFWLNADQVRKEANDWDFSEQGRLRQAERMGYEMRETSEESPRDRAVPERNDDEEMPDAQEQEEKDGRRGVPRRFEFYQWY